MKESVKQWLNSGSYFKYNNLNTFYKQIGTGDDLIIIHGYPYSSYEWKDVIPMLSNNFKVTIFDLLGFGFSDKPENHTYSFEEYVAILNSLTIHLNIAHAHILAHDLGVSIAQELIAVNQNNELNFSVKSICYTNGNLFPDVYKPRFIQRVLSQTPSFIGSFISRKLSKKTIHKTIRNLYGIHSQPSEDFLNELWDILNYKNGKNISYLLGRLVFEKLKYQERWTVAMKNTSIPQAYICGPADPNSGTIMGRTFEMRIPNGEIIWMNNDIGHWPMIEDKNAFIGFYYSWIKKNIIET